MRYFSALLTFAALFFIFFSISFSQLQISEIMFDPISGCPEWIELYNNSEPDISDLTFSISDPVRSYNFTINHSSAKQYIVLAKDTSQLRNVHNIPTDALLISTSIPAMNNDGDSLYLKNADSTILDTLFYDGKWSSKGVSLERANFSSPANSSANLKPSIASDSVTCGKVNSVLETSVKPDSISSLLKIYPNPFSPNGAEGKNQCLIKYILPHKQFKATCIIYNLNGVQVRNLSNDEIFDSELQFIWDGTNNNGWKLPVGVYPTILEIKNMKDGTSYTEKSLIVIGR
jgi:hypothetical protein